MWSHMLVGVDFTPATGMVLEKALELARLYRSRLTLLHVIRPVEIPFELGSGFDFYTAGFMDEQEREARREMNQILEKLRQVAPDIPVETEFRVGFPAVEILEVQKKVQADLIVLGAHKYNILERILVGGTALRVAREAPVSVLVVRRGAEETRKPPLYLVPLALSEPSLKAVEVATDLGHHTGARVLTFTVLPKLRDRDKMQKLAEEARRRAQELLRPFEIPHEIAFGQASVEILRKIKELHPTKVIMAPRRGPRGLVETILGTTTERVLRDAPTTVWVVR